MFCLYQVTNLLNGMYYIGVHRGPMGNYWGSGYGLKAAIKKHGRENFRCDVLAEVETEKFAYQLERAVVDEAFVKSRDNYNRVVGGMTPPAGWHHSEETKREIAIAGTGRKYPNRKFTPNSGNFQPGVPNYSRIGKGPTPGSFQYGCITKPNSGSFKKGLIPANAKLITWNGKTQCISAWGKEVGLGEGTLLLRLKNGWSIEKALTEKKWHVRPLVKSEVA